MVETYDDAICMIINGKINVFQKLVNVKFRSLCPLILYKSDVLTVNLTESDVKKGFLLSLLLESTCRGPILGYPKRS